MKKLLWIMIILFVSLGYLRSEELLIVTENFPPYSYMENNELKGVSTEIVKAVLKEAGFNARIKLYPWARAYKYALTRKNVLIYSISRSPERESLFKWIGVLVTLKVCFHKLKSRTDITPQSLDDLKPYLIGVQQDGSTHDFLINNGFERLEPSDEIEQNIKKMLINRIDMVFASELGAMYRIKALGYDTDDFERIWYADKFSRDLYMAFSLKTPDSIVDQFRKAYEKIVADGTYEAIIKKYLK